MRTMAIALMVTIGCGNGGGGVEEAKRQAAADDQERASKSPPAVKMQTPVPGSAKIPCAQLIDPAAYTTALGEKEPLIVKDSVDAGAAAACSLVRGGKRPNDGEQKSLIKTNGRLGALAGDEICHITAYCWTIENADHFRKRCAEKKDKDDDTMGSFACVHIVATGEDDVPVFQFFDEDTKCILEAKGGPSVVDTDTIRKCAKTARDTIGPAQIAVNPAAAAPAAGSGSAGSSAP